MFLEIVEQENERNGNSSDGAGDGAATGIDGADLGPVGSGDGASRRSDGDAIKPDRGLGTGDGTGDGSSGTGDGDGLERARGSGAAPVGDASGTSGNPGDDRGQRRRRGRPRKSDRGDRIADASGADRSGSGRKVTSKQDNFRGLDQGDPVEVKESLFENSELGKLSKGETVEYLAAIAKALFYIPANLLGQDHWQLTNKEAVELADAVLGVLKTLPSKQTKKVDKFLKEYAPLIRLAMVAGLIVYSRATVSMEIYKQRKLENGNRQKREFTTGTGAGPSNDVAGAGPGIRLDTIGFAPA